MTLFSLILFVVVTTTIVGIVRRKLWGRMLAIFGCSIALLCSLIVVLPDRDSINPSIVENIVGHPPTNTEFYLAIAIAAYPWLIGLSLLIQYKQWFKKGLWN
ncbi:MAG: hypothetical protein KGO49_05395 [Gammaproteobacteria bacterium]|nr:hypothetical protein [Gammaproteobacteria bacterium]